MPPIRSQLPFIFALLTTPLLALSNPWLPGALLFYIPHILHFVAFAALLKAYWHPPVTNTQQQPWLFLGYSGLCFILAGLFLQLAWGYGITSGWFSMGILPTNDAADFYNSALDLLAKGWFDTPRGRPLTNSLVAGLLVFSQFDLKITLLLLASGAIIAILLLTRSIWNRYGFIPGLIMGAILFDYMHDHFGGFSSEPLGFILGGACFTLLWYGVQHKKPFLFIMGLATLGLTMVVRVGPLFLIPALLLWSAWAFRNQKRFNYKIPLIGLLLISIMFIGNSLIAKRVTPHSGGTFVNAVDSWYPLFINGKEALGLIDSDQLLPHARWVQIYQDYPELKTLPRAEMVARKKEILLQEIQTAPLAGVVGGLLEYKKYLLRGGIFGFVGNKRLWAGKAVRWVVFTLTLIGLYGLIRDARRKDPLATFVLAGNIGILLSVPFLYGGGARVYAGTIAFTTMLPVWGSYLLIQRFQAQKEITPPPPISTSTINPQTIIAAIIPLLMITLMTITITQQAGHYKESPVKTCGKGSKAATILFQKGASFQIYPDQDPPDHGPAIPWSLLNNPEEIANRWTKYFPGGPPPWQWSHLKALLPQHKTETLTITHTLDRVSGKGIVLFIPQKLRPAHSNQLVHYCIQKKRPHHWAERRR
ncbi:hypothetical protein ACQZV8_17585 [Magnetococcales bacterium HHB-1]